MSTVRVLLVDDVRLFLEFERSFFDRSGCSIVMATSGEEALELARAERPHIILLDYEMPGMMGDEVCRRLREDEATRHIPVLIVTSHHDEAVRQRCAEAGCTDLVGKPISGRELLDKVVRILEIPYRVHVRTRVRMEVGLGGSGDRMAITGYSENLSEGGILVRTLEPLDPGTKLNLSFNLPGQQGRFETPAEVVRVARSVDEEGYSVGLRYDAPGRSLVERLRTFVMNEVGQ